MIVKLLTSTAQLPSKKRDSDAGYDLYADLTSPITLKTQERGPISTGIAISIPEGYYGRIAPRSGLALKHGIDVFGGVVDQGYTGEVKVILYNQGREPYTINHGDRIAQLILTPYLNSTITVGEVTGDRESGFGSSGR